MLTKTWKYVGSVFGIEVAGGAKHRVCQLI